MIIQKLYKKIRLFSRIRQEPYLLFYRLTGFIPDNLGLYELAMCHKSTGVKDAQGNAVNNERLEFLGDAIINSIVADIVYHRFADKEEGFLTDTRSKIVQRESLNKLAIELGIPKLMQLSPKNGALHGNNIFGNAFEALIGAIYLDQGYERCKQFIETKLIASSIDVNKMANKEVNFKSRLIEWGQSNKVPIEFEVIETFHDRRNELTFQTHVLINGLVGGLGVGHSKKESHQNASKMALKKLQEDEEFNEQVFLPKPEVSTDTEEAEVINESEDQTGELVSDPVVTTVQPEEQTTN